MHPGLHADARRRPPPRCPASARRDRAPRGGRRPRGRRAAAERTSATATAAGPSRLADEPSRSPARRWSFRRRRTRRRDSHRGQIPGDREHEIVREVVIRGDADDEHESEEPRGVAVPDQEVRGEQGQRQQVERRQHVLSQRGRGESAEEHRDDRVEGDDPLPEHHAEEHEAERREAQQDEGEVQVDQLVGRDAEEPVQGNEGDQLGPQEQVRVEVQRLPAVHVRVPPDGEPRVQPLLDHRVEGVMIPHGVVERELAAEHEAPVEADVQGEESHEGGEVHPAPAPDAVRQIQERGEGDREEGELGEKQPRRGAKRPRRSCASAAACRGGPPPTSRSATPRAR